MPQRYTINGFCRGFEGKFSQETKRFPTCEDGEPYIERSILSLLWNYSWGPAATRALPASLVVYLAKFLMKRAAKSLAFSSHSAAVA